MHRYRTAAYQLCLTTHIAWRKELPPILSRRKAHEVMRKNFYRSTEGEKLQGSLSMRVDQLTARVEEAMQVLHGYEDVGYTFILYGEAEYPQTLYRLKEDAPLVLFMLGNRQLLEKPSVAVSGSRSILPETYRFANQIGQKITRKACVLTTGGAKGCDQAALFGAIADHGSGIVVPAVKVQELLKIHWINEAFQNKRLLFLCDDLPDSPFSAKKALQRNHTIYSLADVSVVVAARDGCGGTWRGATDCLRGNWSKVVCMDLPNEDGNGNRTMVTHGAELIDANQFDGCIDKAVREKCSNECKQMSFDHIWS